MPDDLMMSRREQLLLLGGFVLAAAAPAGAAPPVPQLADPAARLDAYIRLRARTDGKPSFMQYQGTIFGKREGLRAVPLFGVIGASWGKATRLEDGRYQLGTVEAGYFTDLATGAVLTRWTNPLNGLETTAKHYKSAQTLLVSADRIEPKRDTPLPEGAEYIGIVPPPIVIGGQVWMGEQLLVRFPNRPKESFADPREYFGPFLTATSLATWTAPLVDVLDATRASAPATLAYQTLGSWRPFMLMGGEPGLISWQMQGLKLARFEEVDSSLRERIMAEHKDFLDGA